MTIYPLNPNEDPFEILKRDMREADSRVKPWQSEIRPGEYFVRRSGLGFNIYGEIVPDEEPRENHLRHYRFCRGYSIACMEGELGDIHVSTIEALLTKEEFEGAKQRGWRP
ncbi:MAG: hypothetical protein Q7S27_02650 [Nanoarchaeota archaeon]|nr:hypothetical protein [Nanoarchaeota archaeon]